jgi:hypothetical protein
LSEEIFPGREGGRERSERSSCSVVKMAAGYVRWENEEGKSERSSFSVGKMAAGYVRWENEEGENPYD